MKDKSTTRPTPPSSSNNSSAPPPQPASQPTTAADPAAQFSLLQAHVQSGLLSAQELVQLAPSVFSGSDPSLVPSIDAILPLKDTNTSEFESAFNLILSQRGINRGVTQTVEAVVATEITAATELSTAGETAAEKEDIEDDDTYVKEIVAIAIDVSGSMECPFEVDDDVRTIDRTRLQAVKQCFYGFRDQTQVHENGSRHLLGLISFSDKVSVHTYPTANLDVFEDVIDDMSSSGRTAIFEAVSVACKQVLGPAARLHPKADLRVLVLSDGLNNCNGVSANQALEALAEVGAVCDCMILGDKTSNADEGLRRLVAASEGQCVQFTGLSDAYEALESPAMISLSSRRNGDTSFDRQAFQARMKSLKQLDTVKAAPMKRGVVQAAKPVAKSSAILVTSYLPEFNPTSLSTLSFAKASVSTAVGKRLMKELKDYSSNPLPNMFIYPGLSESGEVCGDWKVLMVGLQNHPIFSDKVFEISVRFPSDYPFKPPQVSLTTPIYHYAITAEGRACLPILYDTWSPAQTLRHVLQDISDLIHSPQTFDPDCNLAQRSWLSDLLRTNPDTYHAEAVKHTSDHAKSVPQTNVASQAQLSSTDLFGLLA